MERLRYLGIHLDKQLLLLSDLFIPENYFFLHPVTERLSNDCVNHVYEPLTWDFVHVTIVWKIVRNLWILPGSLKYALYVQILILRNVEHFDIIAFDTAKWSEAD